MSVVFGLLGVVDVPVFSFAWLVGAEATRTIAGFIPWAPWREESSGLVVDARAAARAKMEARKLKKISELRLR